MIVGILGGIASGKSTVIGLIAERTNGLIINADQLAHQVLEQPQVIASLVNQFGADIVAADKTVDRKRLGSLVFGDTDICRQNKIFLEQLIHPKVRSKIEAAITVSQNDDPKRLILLDIPLLLESGWKDRCDELLFIDTLWTIRQENAARRGWSEEELAKRERTQMSIESKRAAATVVILNHGTLLELASEIENLTSQWQSAGLVQSN